MTALGTVPLVSNSATLSTGNPPRRHPQPDRHLSGDQAHLAAQSPTLALTITPRHNSQRSSLPSHFSMVNPFPASQAHSPASYLRTHRISSTFATPATTLSPVGTYPITVSLTGPAAGNYALSAD